MDNYKEPIKIEITQDKLVDLLLHTATREDIAKFANETKSDNENLRNEIISVRNELKTDNEKLRGELKSDIAKSSGEAKSDNSRLEMSLKDTILELKRSNEAMENRFNKQLEAFKSHNDIQFQKIDHRYNWIIGTIVGTGIVLGGLIIAIINFTFAAY